jgi:hypothetical protein
MSDKKPEMTPEQQKLMIMMLASGIDPTEGMRDPSHNESQSGVMQGYAGYSGNHWLPYTDAMAPGIIQMGRRPNAVEQHFPVGVRGQENTQSGPAPGRSFVFGNNIDRNALMRK